MRKQVYLTALVPNQHTLLALQQIRWKLYRDRGLASALAFEPVIPITSVPYPVEKDKTIRLLTPPSDGTAPPPPLSTGGFVEVSDHLFLAVDRPELIREIRESLRAYPPADLCPLPLYSGLFMARREVPEEDFSRAPGKISWRSNRIGLYELSFEAEQGPWWDGLEWRLIWQFPFRKWKKNGTLESSG
jgi:hypothetical protein